MRSEVCAVCGRRIACSGDGLRMHRSINAYELAWARGRVRTPSKAEWAAQRAAPWCNGPERQLPLPLA